MPLCASPAAIEPSACWRFLAVESKVAGTRWAIAECVAGHEPAVKLIAFEVLEHPLAVARRRLALVQRLGTAWKPTELGSLARGAFAAVDLVPRPASAIDFSLQRSDVFHASCRCVRVRSMNACWCRELTR